MTDFEHERRSRHSDREREVPVDHEEHRHNLRRESDREMMQRLRNEPLTINRLVVVLGVYFFISQGISWWRSSNVEPKAFETLSAQVATLTTEMRDLKQLFKDKQQGDNFYYFSLCYSWRQKFPIQYPRFCDNPDIQQFDPTGRAIAPPR